LAKDLLSLYLFDTTGRRVAKRVQVSGLNSSDLWTFYTYDGWRVLEERELTGSPRLKRQFVYGNYLDEPLAMDVVDSGMRYLYLQNTLFSVTGLVDASNGALVEAYAYDPYGRHWRITNAGNPITNFSASTLTFALGAESTLGNPYLFTGQRFDPETGLHYYKMRYYDCGLGRFVSRDPIRYKGGINLYGYVMSIPTKETDPFGLFGYVPGLDYDYTNQSFWVALHMTAYGIDKDDPYNDLAWKLIWHWFYGFGRDLDISGWAGKLKYEGTVEEAASKYVRRFAAQAARSSKDKGTINHTRLAPVQLFSVQGGLSNALLLINFAELWRQGSWSKECVLDKDKKVNRRIRIDPEYAIIDRADRRIFWDYVFSPWDPFRGGPYTLRAKWKDPSSWIAPGKTGAVDEIWVDQEDPKSWPYKLIRKGRAARSDL